MRELAPQQIQESCPSLGRITRTGNTTPAALVESAIPQICAWIRVETRNPQQGVRPAFSFVDLFAAASPVAEQRMYHGKKVE
jgi:hypothetical protein